MRQYRKKPVVIEAVQWTGNNLYEIVEFIGKGVLNHSAPPTSYEHLNDITNNLVKITIPTREGEQVADRYDYIIKGYTKEYGIHCWVCKPDCFKDAYELLEDQTTNWITLYEINNSVI